jgi:phytoene desaturase
METQKCDIAIVGGGIGGLCAGVLLVKSGYKVLLAEKRSRLGGRWSTEEVEGFKLPMGAIVIHKGGIIDDVFKKVGKEQKGIPPAKLFYRLKGKDYDVTAKGAVGLMLNLIADMEVNKAKLMGGMAKEIATEKIKMAFRGGVKEPEKIERVSFTEWLNHYTDNELVHQLYDVINVALLCARSDEIPAAEVFSFFAKMGGQKDIVVAPRGNIENANALGDAIKESGNIWLDCEAKQIVVESGRAKGVILEKGGKEIKVNSEVVISNVGPKMTVELVGEKNYDKKYLTTMHTRLRPTPVILNLIASDRPLWMEGESATLVIVGARRLTGVLPLTNFCPELAPKNQHLTYAIGAPLRSTKMNVEEEIKANDLDIKEHLPDFEKHGRIIRRRICDVDSEFPEVRTWPGYDMPRETPIKNLYDVGDATKSPGWSGTSGAAESGVRVAAIIQNRLK